MSIKVEWFGHASFKLSNGSTVYIDPWKLGKAYHDASVVLVSHSHYDHYSVEDIGLVAHDGTKLIGPADVIKQYGGGQVIRPGERIEVGEVKITAVTAYNPNKKFHPKANEWLGFVVEIDGKRIYYAGDTDLIPEMESLSEMDLVLLPVGGTYTMNAEEAAAVIDCLRAKRAIPYHWGDIVGNAGDAKAFKKKADCEVTILQPGESMLL